MTTSESKAKPGQRGGGRRPVDSKTRNLIVALGRAGELSRNAIATKVGVSPSTVSRICAEATPPVTFDRSAVRAAQEAVQLDHKARRQKLSAGLLDDLDKLRGMFFADAERKHFSVTYGEQVYLAPPGAGEVRDLFTAFGIALDKHLLLERTDTDDQDLAAVDRFIAHVEGANAEAVPEGWQ